MGMDSIRESARSVPVIDEAEVVVAGGGPAGVAAAVSAARAGAAAALAARTQSPTDEVDLEALQGELRRQQVNLTVAS